MDKEQEVIKAIELITDYISNTSLAKLGLYSAEIDIVKFELNKVKDNIEKP